MTGISASASAIRAYADLTRDYNPIHLDPEFAGTTAMGRVIAHGTMSLNLVWLELEERLGVDALIGATIDAKFIAAVHVDDDVKVVVTAETTGACDVEVRVQRDRLVIAAKVLLAG